MGVLGELQHVQTHGGATSCVDEHSREIFRLPAEFAGGDIEVYRRDLSRVLYEHGAGRAEYLFGDAITNLAQTDDWLTSTSRGLRPAPWTLLSLLTGCIPAYAALCSVRNRGSSATSASTWLAGICPTTWTPASRRSSTTSRAGWRASAPTCGTRIVPLLSSCSRHPCSTAAGTTLTSTRKSLSTRSLACAGTSRICSTPCTTRKTCTSTRSAGLPCPLVIGPGRPAR
jgi:hypothetical protein